ncbi:MAG: hypothetical protein ACRDTF_05415, partial [Pseudonocardiaceae bacterium]
MPRHFRSISTPPAPGRSRRTHALTTFGTALLLAFTVACGSSGAGTAAPQGPAPTLRLGYFANLT